MSGSLKIGKPVTWLNHHPGEGWFQHGMPCFNLVTLIELAAGKARSFAFASFGTGVWILPLADSLPPVTGVACMLWAQG